MSKICWLYRDSPAKPSFFVSLPSLFVLAPFLLPARRFLFWRQNKRRGPQSERSGWHGHPPAWHTDTWWNVTLETKGTRPGTMQLLNGRADFELIGDGRMTYGHFSEREVQRLIIMWLLHHLNVRGSALWRHWKEWEHRTPEEFRRKVKGKETERILGCAVFIS